MWTDGMALQGHHIQQSKPPEWGVGPAHPGTNRSQHDPWDLPWPHRFGSWRGRGQVSVQIYHEWSHSLLISVAESRGQQERKRI